jgi:hypothetical protein
MMPRARSARPLRCDRRHSSSPPCSWRRRWRRCAGYVAHSAASQVPRKSQEGQAAARTPELHEAFATPKPKLTGPTPAGVFTSPLLTGHSACRSAGCGGAAGACRGRRRRAAATGTGILLQAPAMPAETRSPRGRACHAHLPRAGTSLPPLPRGHHVTAATQNPFPPPQVCPARCRRRRRCPSACSWRCCWR